MINPNELRDISQKLALLDAIVMPEWDYRYYSFNSNWSSNTEMGSMRDGSGNCYFILFEDECKKCFIKIIDKEHMHTTEIIDKVKKIESTSERKEIEIFLEEPAFQINEISYLYWNINNSWKAIEFEKTNWLNIFSDPVTCYQSFAKNYYEIELPVMYLESVINGKITKDIIIKMNPSVDIDKLNDDANEIGIKIC